MTQSVSRDYLFLPMRALLTLAFVSLCPCDLRAESPVNPPEPVRVVFHRVTFHQPGQEPTNTKIIAWRNGLTAIDAIIAAGGISTPPTRKGKIIRGDTEIPLDLKRLTRGDSDVPLKPGDIVFLY